jgi:hypothetical protein
MKKTFKKEIKNYRIYNYYNRKIYRIYSLKYMINMIKIYNRFTMYLVRVLLWNQECSPFYS